MGDDRKDGGGTEAQGGGAPPPAPVSGEPALCGTCGERIVCRPCGTWAHFDPAGDPSDPFHGWLSCGRRHGCVAVADPERGTTGSLHPPPCSGGAVIWKGRGSFNPVVRRHKDGGLVYCYRGTSMSFAFALFCEVGEVAARSFTGFFDKCVRMKVRDPREETICYDGRPWFADRIERLPKGWREEKPGARG